MFLSHPFKEDGRALPLSTPLSFGDRWRDIFGFVPAGSVLSVSSSSTLQILRGSRNRPLVMAALLAILSARSFPVTGMSRITHPGVFEGGCRTVSYMPIWASHSDFASSSSSFLFCSSKLIESVMTMACLVTAVTSRGNPAQSMCDCFHSLRIVYRDFFFFFN